MSRLRSRLANMNKECDNEYIRKHEKEFFECPNCKNEFEIYLDTHIDDGTLISDDIITCKKCKKEIGFRIDEEETIPIII